MKKNSAIMRWWNNIRTIDLEQTVFLFHGKQYVGDIDLQSIGLNSPLLRMIELEED